MNQKKRITSLLLTGISTLALCATPTFAETTGVITGITVRMRAEPSTSSKIITNLDQDNKVEVLEKKDDWYKVSYKGDTGYVFGEYIKVNGEVEESPKEEETKEVSSKPTEEEQENKEENTSKENQTPEIALDSTQKIQENTELYALPLLSSSKTIEIEKNAEVRVLQVLNNWVYVSNSKTSGWIVKQKLQPVNKEQPKETENNKPEENDKNTNTSTATRTAYVNVENANIREKPTTDSEHVDTLKLNTEVTILGEEENWYKVKAGKVEGYIYSKLVSDEKVKQTTSSRSGENRTVAKTVTKTEEPKQENNENTNKTEPEQSTSTSQTVTGASIVEYAKKYLGCKYVSGGNGPKSFDCSGFTTYVYKHFGYSLNRTSGGQASNGVKVEKANLQAGDILIFLNDAKTKIGHVGIYISNNNFIHAANPSRGVTIDSITSSYYAPRYVSARRII